MATRVINAQIVTWQLGYPRSVLVFQPVGLNGASVHLRPAEQAMFEHSKRPRQEGAVQYTAIRQYSPPLFTQLFH